jgi:signal transduction histidine kinase
METTAAAPAVASCPPCAGCCSSGPSAPDTIGRNVQEALANVAKHAQAHHVTIRQQHTDTAIVVEVEDDGAGTPAS